MSFQWVIDNAENISINNLRQTSQTTSRDGTVKTTSRGYVPRRFTVKMPDGMPWDVNRNYIQTLEDTGRINTNTVQFNNTGQDWMFFYQGDSANLTAFSGGVAIASVNNGSNIITLTSSDNTLTTGQYKFKTGDFIQLGSDSIYTVKQNVAYNGTSVILHKPVVESTATGVVLKTGENCVFTLRCVVFPQWNIFARNQIAWSGAFEFIEEV